MDQLELWEKLYNLSRSVPKRFASRHLVGLALAPLGDYRDVGDKTFLMDRDALWFAAVDVPHGHWRTSGKPRLATWTTLLRAKQVFGLPTLGADYIRSWDMRVQPVLPGQRPAQYAFDPAISPDYFAVLNDIDVAMSSARYRMCRGWKEGLGQDGLAKLGLAETIGSGINLGGEIYQRLAYPAEFMPRPYLAFPRSGDLWASLLRAAGRIPEVIYKSFSDDMAKPRTSGLPIHLSPSGHVVLDKVRTRPIEATPDVLRSWFNSQIVAGLAEGLVHVPAELAALLAHDHAHESELAWCVNPCAQYLSKTSTAFILPPIRMREWDEYAGVLPGEVAVDFTPQTQRFIPRIAQLEQELATDMKNDMRAIIDDGPPEGTVVKVCVAG